MKNILVAVNSFKETADAVEVAGLFNQYLDKSIFNVIQKPISDGGDGFLNVCNFYFDLELITYPISAPYDETLIDCVVGLDRNNKTMFVESAEAIGLKKIPHNKRHPLELNSKGLGDLLQLIIQDIEDYKYEVDKMIIGIGGTGIMDVGLGMCSRFGLKLSDSYGSELEVFPENFINVNEIEFSKIDYPFSVETILDVDNLLLGKNGASIYGKQKGASVTDIKIIEKGWNNIINLLHNNMLIDTTKELSGAGGGLNVGLKLLFDVNEKKAINFISKDLKINTNDKDIDMIITGEGSFDKQSLMGKGAGSIISLFDHENIPVVLCCGKIDRVISENLSMNVFPIELQTYIDDPINNFEEAIKIACDEISGMTDILTKIS
ncbi:MAG TPA: glycerate kinase [Ignavibacteriaceae bacterium]|nr:glycerate kinase [Ignavibacteriaceae bacterium]